MVTVRQLGVELRRSTAPLAGMLGAALLGLLLILRPDEWANGWTGLSLTFRNDLPVLLPLALAAGAWQGGRDRRAAVEELTTTTSRSGAQRVLLPAAAVVLGLLAALGGTLLVGAVAGGQGLWRGQMWPVAVAAVGLLAVAAAVTFGVALGRLVRSDLVAPLALVVLFFPLLVLEASDYVDSWPRLLTGGIEPATVDTLQVRTAVTVGQAVWFTALLAAGLLLATGGRSRTRVLSAVPLLVGLVLAVPLLSSGGGVAYAIDPAAARPDCASGQPVVCVAVVHRSWLPAVTGPARDVLVALQRLPDPPQRAVEQVGALRPATPAAPSDVLPLVLTGRSSDTADLAERLAEGFGVRPCSNTPGGPADAYDARLVAGAWLLDLPLDRPTAAAALQRLRAMPTEVQRDRMAELREALRSCDRNPLELLR